MNSDHPLPDDIEQHLLDDYRVRATHILMLRGLITEEEAHQRIRRWLLTQAQREGRREGLE